MPVMYWNMQILLIGCNKRFADRLYHSRYCVWRWWQAFFTQRQGWQTDQETFHVPLVVQVRVLFISAHKCTCTCAVDSRQWPGWKYIALMSVIITVKSHLMFDNAFNLLFYAYCNNKLIIHLYQTVIGSYLLNLYGDTTSKWSLFSPGSLNFRFSLIMYMY